MMEYVMWMLIVVNTICMGAMALCGVTFSLAMVWFVTLTIGVILVSAGVYEEGKSLD